jgi:hypothetical protein
MGSAFVVQQRDGRGSRWRTVTGESTHAVATGLADKLRHVLDGLPKLPAPPVRVIGTDELADEARISRHAAEMLRRCPPRSWDQPRSSEGRGAVLHFPSMEANRRPPDAPPSYQKVRAATRGRVTRRR